MDNKSVLVVMDIQKGFLGDNPKLPIKNENKNKFLNGISELIDAWVRDKNEVVYVKTVYAISWMSRKIKKNLKLNFMQVSQKITTVPTSTLLIMALA